MFFNKILYQFSSTAAKKGIDNSFTDEALTNIKELDQFIEEAYNSWSKYSALHGIPQTKFIIVSAYRCPKLNKAVGGVDKSPHTIGCAADIYIKQTAYWFEYCCWMAEFAKECFQRGRKYDQIAPESNGKYNWMHISIKDTDGNQLMKTIETPNEGEPFKSVMYGKQITYASANLNQEIATKQHNQESKDPTSQEIEGERGHVRTDLVNIYGSYARVIYIAKRLMGSLGMKPYQACGVIGNLLYDTNGRLSTTLRMNGNAGICRWTSEDQLRYRRLFMGDETLAEGNLMSQTSFLIHELGHYKLVEKIRKCPNLLSACMKFYEKYERWGEHVDKLDTDTKKECSARRGYAVSALEIYNTYKDVYKDEWLVGYYSGNGVNDGAAVEMGDDPKLWNSHDIVLDSTELETYATMMADSANEIEEKMKDWQP